MTFGRSLLLSKSLSDQSTEQMRPLSELVQVVLSIFLVFMLCLWILRKPVPFYSWECKQTWLLQNFVWQSILLVCYPLSKETKNKSRFHKN